MCRYLTLKRIFEPTAENRIALASVVNECPAFFLLSEGKLPHADAVIDEFFEDVPLPVDWHVGRYVYLVMQDDIVVGLVDVLRGWKLQTQSMIGLFLIRESFQDRHLGVEAHALMELEIGTWPECTSLRIGVNVTNHKALRFWDRMGYRDIGFRTRIDGQITDVDVFEKPLIPPPSEQAPDQKPAGR